MAVINDNDGATGGAAGAGGLPDVSRKGVEERIKLLLAMAASAEGISKEK